MRKGIMVAGIALLLSAGLAGPAPAQENASLPDLVVSGAPGLTSRAARLNAAMHRLDALLETASRNHGIANHQPRSDNARNPLEAAVDELDIALDAFLDAFEDEFDDLSIDDQAVVVQYVFSVADTVENLDGRTVQLMELPDGHAGTRDRLIEIIDDLNTDG